MQSIGAEFTCESGVASDSEPGSDLESGSESDLESDSESSFEFESGSAPDVVEFDFEFKSGFDSDSDSEFEFSLILSWQELKSNGSPPRPTPVRVPKDSVFPIV